jgi:hypothetical protein
MAQMSALPTLAVVLLDRLLNSLLGLGIFTISAALGLYSASSCSALCSLLSPPVSVSVDHWLWIVAAAAGCRDWQQGLGF